MPDPNSPSFVPWVEVPDITGGASPSFVPYQEPQQSQGMDWWETGIRTLPAVAGGVLGGVFGNVPGAMAGGALGSAIGNIGGQLYHGGDFNPYEFGVETALGAVPPIFGAGKVAAPGIRGLINYGAKQAGINAIEGGLVSAGATPFQHAAQTGSFNAPAEAYLSNAAGGAVLGGALGGVLGGYQGHLQQIGHTAAAPPPVQPPPTAGGLGQMDMLAGVPPGPPPTGPSAQQSLFPSDQRPMNLQRGSSFEPYGDFAEPTQQQFPGMEMQGDMFGGQQAEYPMPFVPPGQPPTSPGAPPPAPPTSITPVGGNLPQTVSLRHATLSDVNLWKNQGYVYVEGLKGSDGYAMMARGDVAPMYVQQAQQQAPPPPAPVNRPEVPSAMGANQAAANDTVIVPTDKANNPSFLANMEKGGYRLVENQPGGVSVFKRMLEQFIDDDEGSVDYGTMWANLKRMFGRDPVPEEVDAAMARQKSPAEPGGRVAEFPLTPAEAPWLRPPDEPELAQPLSPEEEAALIEGGHLLPEQAQGYPPGMMVDDDTDYGIMSFPNKGTPGSENISYLSDQPSGPNDFTVPDDRSSIGEAIPGVDQPVPPQIGQQELPFGPFNQLDNRPTTLYRTGQIEPESPIWRTPSGEPSRYFFGERSDAENRANSFNNPLWALELPQSKADQYQAGKRPGIYNVPQDVARESVRIRGMDALDSADYQGGEQLSMEGAMKDAEIAVYLRNEDQLPPEMRDLSTYQKLKKITKEFLEDESGESNIHEAMRRLRQTVTRVLADNRRRAAEGGTEVDLTSAQEQLTYMEGLYGREADVPPAPTSDIPPITPENVRQVRGSDRLPQNEAETTARQQVNDRAEIARTETPTRIDEIIAFWREELGRMNAGDDTDAQKHASNMLSAAEARARVIREDRVHDRIRTASEIADDEIAGPPAQVEGGSVEVFNTREGRVIARFDTHNDAARYIALHPDSAQLDYEDRLHSTARRRREELAGGFEEETRSQGEQARESREAANRRREDEDYDIDDDDEAQRRRPVETVPRVNPPIKFGMQEPRPRGQRPKISREQAERAEASISQGNRERGRKRKSEYLRGRNAWDNSAARELSHEPDGTPGLEIIDKTYRSGNPGDRYYYESPHKDYKLVYRDPNGKPIVVAQVREDENGRRAIGSLYADRFRGLLSGRAVTAVGDALVDMNATEARGIVSEHTAHLIMKLSKFIADDEGSYEIGRVLKSLIKLKEDFLTKPLFNKKITSTEDVENLVAAMSGDSSFSTKLASFLRDETGAIPAADATPGAMWGRAKEMAGWGQGASKTGRQDPNETNWLREALSVPSAATTTGDFSAPGRQGLALINTKEFWKAAGAMFKGLSPEGFKQIDADLRNKPIFQKKVDLETGKVSKSFAEEIGMKLFSPASTAPIGKRAEATASRWLETGGSIPYLSAGYSKTAGVPIRATNRAFITFLNHLNANRTEFLLNKARDMSIQALDTGEARPGFLKQKYSPAEAMELNPYHNIVLAKEIADFVNTATGHGPLKTHLLPFKQAELSLEGSAKVLNLALFSPGLLASRIRMLNPSTYIMASPMVRKQYMKAALSTAGAWYGFTELIKMAGGNDVEVNNDLTDVQGMTSADFGKIRIGDTRLDPGGGFLQFLVQYARMYKGGYTSSASQEFNRFGEGFQAETQLSNAQRFMSNKLNPVAKFGYDLMNATQYNPFHAYDRTAQLFVPLVIQDINELAREDPSLLPWMVPITLGMGTQTYSKGESIGKFVPPENDWLVQGGGVQDLIP